MFFIIIPCYIWWPFIVVSLSSTLRVVYFTAVYVVYSTSRFFTAVFLSSDDETNVWRAPSYHTRFPERTTGSRHERANIRAFASDDNDTRIWWVVVCVFGESPVPLDQKKKTYWIYYVTLLYYTPVCCMFSLLTKKCLVVQIDIQNNFGPYPWKLVYIHFWALLYTLDLLRKVIK